MSEFRWEFGTAGFIEVYKDGVTCAHFIYNNRLKVHVAWTTVHLYQNEWDQVLICVKEAKTILKKLKRI